MSKTNITDTIKHNNEIITEVCTRLLGLSINETKHHVFVQYSPHVDWCEVRIFKNKWVEDKQPDCYQLDLDKVSSFKRNTLLLVKKLVRLDILDTGSSDYERIVEGARRLVI